MVSILVDNQVGYPPIGTTEAQNRRLQELRETGVEIRWAVRGLNQDRGEDRDRDRGRLPSRARKYQGARAVWSEYRGFFGAAPFRRCYGGDCDLGIEVRLDRAGREDLNSWWRDIWAVSRLAEGGASSDGVTPVVFRPLGPEGGSFGPGRQPELEMYRPNPMSW